MKFWIKTLFYRFVPFRLDHFYGYYDPNYIHDNDKHPVRIKHHGKAGWKKQWEDEIHYRDYNSYKEYLVHQIQKFNEILKTSGGFNNIVIARYRLNFYQRFRHLYKYLPKTGKILCAGARQGTEVEVLRDLGFKNAYGIDLNPGPNNKYVRVGDFMKLDNPDSSLDMIYSNCIDHAYDLNSFFSEHARVIKPDGFVLYDFSLIGYGEGPFESVEWKSDDIVINLMLKYFKSVVKVELERNWKWILLRGKKL